MTIGERIKERRKTLGLSVEELADKLGKNRATVYRYENGSIEDMPTMVLESIANVLNTTPAYLMGYSDSDRFWAWAQDFNTRNFPDAIAPAETTTYPLLGDVACGQPVIANNEHEVFSTGKRIDADAVIRAKGDSMTGARILDGDIVFVRYQTSVEDGEIAAVLVKSDETYDWEIVLKRFKRYADDLIVLHSENPAYPDMVFKGNAINRLRVIGKAVAFQSDLM